MCIVVTHRDFWHHDCSATFATCLIFTIPTTVHSKVCRRVRRRRNTEAAATTTVRTAPRAKVCIVECLHVYWTHEPHWRKSM